MYVQHRALRRAQDVRKQLISIMDRYKLDIISGGKDYKRIRKLLRSSVAGSTAFTTAVVVVLVVAVERRSYCQQ